MENSNDPGAQQAARYMSMVNGMSGYGAMMNPSGKSAVISNLKDGGTTLAEPKEAGSFLK